MIRCPDKQLCNMTLLSTVHCLKHLIKLIKPQQVSRANKPRANHLFSTGIYRCVQVYTGVCTGRYVCWVESGFTLIFNDHNPNRAVCCQGNPVVGMTSYRRGEVHGKLIRIGQYVTDR